MAYSPVRTSKGWRIVQAPEVKSGMATGIPVAMESSERGVMHIQEAAS
jgi:hypothetical protein